MRVAVFGQEFGLPEAVFFLLTGQEPGSKVKGYVSGVGMGEFPDPRLAELARIVVPRRLTPDRAEFHLFLGMGPMWSDGRAGEVFNALAGYDAFLVVAGDEAGLDDLLSRFLVADLEATERLLPQLKKTVASGHDDPAKLSLLERFHEALCRGQALLSLGLSDHERRMVSEYGLLSLRPGVACLENEPSGAPALDWIAAPFDILREVWGLPEPEKKAMIRDLNLEDPVPGIFQKLWRSTGKIHFFTPGPEEIREISVRQGAKAPEAAGRVHSDMERRFVAAWVAPWHEVVAAGSWAGAKAGGKARKHGRDYTVQDGDVLEILFSG